MGQPVLDRPPTAPEVAPPGPPNSDKLPTTNARGQIRGPAPTLEPEVEAAIKRKIAKDLVALERAEAIEAADGEIVATTGEADAIPIIGWAAALVEAGVAVYEGVQIYTLLKEIQALQNQLEEAEKAKENVKVEGKKQCRTETITFDSNGYDKFEYQRQLTMQQNALNVKGACKSYSDKDSFDQKTQSQKETDRAAATKIQRSYTSQYRLNNPGANTSNLAALHRLDMVAGGDKSDIGGMGDRGVNSSIGPEWNAVTRGEKMKQYAKEMCEQGCPMMIILTAV